MKILHGKERNMLKYAVGSVLLVTATHCVALSLGGTQGSVIIGRPLDVMIQSSITAAEASSGLCLEAEVLYGDARVPATAVTVAIHRAGLDGTGALRVRSTEPVNEPIVTLMLKAGCQQVFRRSYSLLADVEPTAAVSRPPPAVTARNTFEPREIPLAPSAVTPGAPAPMPGVSMPGAARPQPPAPRPAPTVAAPQSSGTVSRPPEAPEVQPALEPETPIRLSAPAPRPAGVSGLRSKAKPDLPLVPAGEGPGAAPAAAAPVRSEAPASTGPRLKLDPVELPPSGGSVTAAPSLPATEAVSPSGAPSDPATTAVPTPGEEALQQELQALRAEQERMRVAMETLNAQLARAEQNQAQSSAGNGWLYGLGAAVVALLGALVVLMRRRQAPAAVLPDVDVSTPWWEPSTQEIPAAKTPAPVADKATPVAVPTPVVPEDQWASSSHLDGMEINEAGESLFREVPISPLHFTALMDIWQRADFFESIGQYGDAMDVLKSFVSENPRASEAPYLRWVAIAKAHGNAADQSTSQAFYEHHYQRLLSSKVDNRLLEEDRSFMQELIRSWPELPSRELLQRTLASQPADPSNALTVRSTESFDDLIMLLGVDELLGQEETGSTLTPPPTFAPTEVASPPASRPQNNEPAEVVFPDWASASDLDKVLPEPPVPAKAQAPAPALAAQVSSLDEPMLDFVLPDVTAPAPASLPAQAQTSIAKAGDPGLPAGNAAPSAKDLKPLDFDLFDLEPKAPKAPDPKA
jgi:pilus assembly protein FimV